MTDKIKLPITSIPATKLKIITSLPPSVYRRIGKIISSYAFLETQVLELLFELAQIEHPVGRVAFRYQAASEQFKIIRRLLILHNISTSQNMKKLLQRIDKCCKIRDCFGHGIWVETKNNEIGLRLTRGEFELPEGIVDRSFAPQISIYSDKFIETARIEAIAVGRIVAALKREVISAFAARNAKHG